MDADARAQEAWEAFQWALSEAIPEDDLDIRQGLEDKAVALAQAKADAEGQRQALAVLEECQRIHDADPDQWGAGSPEFVLAPMRTRVLSGEFAEVKHGTD